MAKKLASLILLKMMGFLTPWKDPEFYKLKKWARTFADDYAFRETGRFGAGTFVAIEPHRLVVGIGNEVEVVDI